MAVLHSDDFNRANNTSLGSPWGGGAGITIVSNQIAVDGSVDTQVYDTTAIPGNDNAYCQAKVSVTAPAGTESGPGLLMSKTDGVTYRLIVATAATNITLAKFEPSYSVLWNRSATFSNGDTLRMEIIGTTFRVYVNGIQVGADQTIPSWAGTLTAGMAGSSTFPSGILDDWEMGTIDALGIPSPIADIHAGRFGPF